jgi:hypothetical protein
MMDNENKQPCCANEALQRVTIIRVNGIPTGIALLGKILDEVKAMHITDEVRLKEILLEKVKVYNYIPRGAGDAYGEALVKKYRSDR